MNGTKETTYCKACGGDGWLPSLPEGVKARDDFQSVPGKHPYPFIRAWGSLLRRDADDVRDTIEQALAEGAPDDALYRHEDGHWVTMEDLKANPEASKGTIAYLERSAGVS